MSGNPFHHLHAGIKYLADRGCTPEQAAKLHIEFVTHETANEYLRTDKNKRSYYKKRDALWIPTHQADGTVHPYHGQAIFFNPAAKPFKMATAATVTYPNEVNILPTETPIRSAAPGSVVYWCESTLKASILNSLGHYAIGMNGVSGYSRGKNQLALGASSLPAELKHVLITDSLNTKNKKSLLNVINARKRWALAVGDIYPAAELGHIELPQPPANWPKGDWGLDDFYVTRHVSALHDLLKTPSQFKSYSPMDTMIEYFNTKFVYVKAVSKIYDLTEKVLLSPADFHSNMAPYQVLLDKTEVAVSRLWFKSKSRPEVSNFVFRPEAEYIVDDCLNLWRGFGVEPETSEAAQANVQKYWLDTVFDAFGEEEGQHFINFCAYLVQNPAKRMSRFMFIGGQQGTGKGYMIFALQQIFGKHTQAFSVDNFVNNFNAISQVCRLGILNEPGSKKSLKPSVCVALGENLKKNADQSEHTMQLTFKGKDTVNCDRLQTNIVTSNYDPPFDLMSNDRRALCLRAGKHMATAQPNNAGTKPLDYWGERWNWLNYENGAAAIMAYLLTVDLSEVDMDGPAPVTPYKLDLIKHAEKDLTSFMQDFGSNPTCILSECLAGMVDERDSRSESEVQAEIDKFLVGCNVFDAEVISAAYTNMYGGSIINQGGFNATVGKDAFSIWEVQSARISSRRHVKDNPASARVYGLQDNKIVDFAKLGLSAREAFDQLVVLKTALVKGM